MTVVEKIMRKEVIWWAKHVKPPCIQSELFFNVIF